MIDSLYRFFLQTGYSHPWHPMAAHLPAGCIMAAFVFLVLSRLSRNPSYFQTARHCMGLALFFLPFTVLLGYLDWQRYLAGAWILPIQIKLGLAATLFVFMLLAVSLRRNLNRPGGLSIFINLVCLILVMGLGYFGGELVHGTERPDKAAPKTESLDRQGATVVYNKHAKGRYQDRSEAKIGPGPESRRKMPRQPGGGRSMNEQRLRKLTARPDKAKRTPNILNVFRSRVIHASSNA